MAKTFSLSTTVNIARTHSNQPDTDGPITTDNNAWKFADLLSNGTGTNQANAAFHDIRSLGDTSSETLDLTGSLRDGFGDLLTFTKIKGIFIAHLTEGADGGLYVGAFTNPLAWLADSTDKLLIHPGGAMFWTHPAGIAVTDGASDGLFLQNLSTGTIQYEILLVGTV